MEKISLSLRKRIKTLSTAKGRKDENAFITERTKNVFDLIPGRFALRWLVATDEWFKNNELFIRDIPSEKLFKATMSELERMTTLNSASDVLAVFNLPSVSEEINFNRDELYIALDNIQDPGNMGTILRLADWFGVKTILASKNTVDVFNPKCVISSMGSISRVNVVYCDLTDVIGSAEVEVWGTFLDGKNIYQIPGNKKQNGIIIFGNEGKGISSEVADIVTQKLFIPNYPNEEGCAESLNVATAVAVTLSEFRRLYFKTI